MFSLLPLRRKQNPIEIVKPKFVISFVLYELLTKIIPLFGYTSSIDCGCGMSRWRVKLSVVILILKFIWWPLRYWIRESFADSPYIFSLFKETFILYTWYGWSGVIVIVRKYVTARAGLTPVNIFIFYGLKYELSDLSALWRSLAWFISAFAGFRYAGWELVDLLGGWLCLICSVLGQWRSSQSVSLASTATAKNWKPVSRVFLSFACLHIVLWVVFWRWRSTTVAVVWDLYPRAVIDIFRLLNSKA